MMHQASAVYDVLVPMGWVGAEPAERDAARRPGAEVPPDWHDVVVNRVTRSGIKVTAQRRGFVVYDFTAWSPGIPVASGATSGRSPVRTVGDVSKVAKPALVQRLRVINSHLTLLHAESLAGVGESPVVVRVGERDLFRHDVDDGAQEIWYQPWGAGGLDVVTHIDRHRHGVIPQDVFERSLDALDAVIEADALISFDLLNQAQTALSTHDYSLTVVAAWTVCELRTCALAQGLPGITANSHASDFTKALRQADLLPSHLAAQLDRVRGRRNSWLHDGSEPTETEATEALGAAVQVLRDIVPNLQLRPTSRLLIL